VRIAKKPPSNSNNTAALVPKPTIDLPFKGEVKKKQGQEKEEKGVTFCLPLILLKSQQGTKHRRLPLLRCECHIC
jgi:hypothetical protein